MPAKLSPQEALIYAMVTTSAVDRSMSDEELARIGSIVSQLPMFDGFNSDLLEVSKACGALLSGDNGLNNVLDIIVKGLPASQRETCYMLALEVAAADLEVKDEEIRFLELLADALDLDQLIVSALERGVKARNQPVA